MNSKESLHAKSSTVPFAGRAVESNPGAGLPAIFKPQEPGKSAMAVYDPIFQATPYVQFVSRKGQGFAKLAPYIPELEEGDPVLINPSPEPPKLLQPFQFYLLSATTHYSKVDGQGQITETSFDKGAPERDGKFLEHIEAVILVVTDKGLVPARCTFKTTKCGCIHDALSALKKAESPEWGSLSAEHKESLVATDPRFRFVSRVRLERKSGGEFPYVLARSIAKPTGIADWRALTEFLANPANAKKCTEVVKSYENRVSSLKSKSK